MRVPGAVSLGRGMRVQCRHALGVQSEGMTESFAQLFEQSLANQRIRPGMILTGLVIDVTSDVVIVNVGLKSEAVIPLEQFKNERGEVEVKAGDQVEVALDSVEDGTGETRLSREKAKRARTWTRLEEAFNKSEIVTGVITGRVKGGFTVEIENVRAFLPGSLVDVRPVRDTSYLEGKPLEFKVIKLDQKRNNVVVSRRAVVEQEFSAERSALMENLQEGAVVRGTVKNLTDMAWKRVKHPSEVVKVGDEVEVRILKFDRERSRVSLGLKQLGADPWQNIARRYPPSTRVFGKVTNIADYGAFVEIEDGVEGLVHVSEMDWTNKNVNPARLVHLSDISWDLPGEEAVRNYQKGQQLEAMVLSIDPERERISLGIKQLAKDPFSAYIADNPKGTIVKGVVKEVDARGAVIDLGNGVEGQLRASELGRERVEDARAVLKVGDEVEAKFTGVDRKSRTISLSIKAKEAHEEAEAVQSYRSETAPSGTSLGDLLKEHIGSGER